MYMSLLGPQGLKKTAQTGIERAHYAANRLERLPGVHVVNAPFGNEFTVKLPVRAYEVIDKLLDMKFVPGFPLGRYYRDMDNHLLVACTEKTTNQCIGILAELIGGAL
jgi:glycine dehydrogenase subunit 1